MNVKKYLLTTFILICLGSFGVAQIVDVPLSEIKFKKGGTATKLESHCYQLTNDQNWNSGAIWYPALVNLKENFEMEVELFFGCSDAGADGIVFIFSPNLRIGYAYDYTLTNLGNFNSGSHEIFLLFNFDFERTKTEF